MKRAIAGVLACCLLLGLLQSPASAIPYRIVNCGALDGAVYASTGGLSTGWGINNHGQVVGYSNDSGGTQHAIIWDEASGLRQMTLSGRSITGGYQINNNGVAIVDADRLWNGPDVSIGFQPFGLNDNLEVVGKIDVGGVGHAALWSPDHETVDLGIPDGMDSSWASGLNNAGQVLIDTRSWPGGYHAYVWDSTHGTRDMGLLAGYEQSRSTDISDKGEVVGSLVHDSGGDRVETTFIWDENHGMRAAQSLGLPAGCGVSAINSSSWLTGNTEQGAYVWDSSNGLTILPTLGGSRSEAYDINDNGWIVGGSYDANGNRYACVWIPVPEPPSLACLLLPLLCLGARLIRHPKHRAA